VQNGGNITHQKTVACIGSRFAMSRKNLPLDLGVMDGLYLPVTARSKVDIHESKRKANKGVGGEKCGTKQMSQNIALFTVWQCIEGF